MPQKKSPFDEGGFFKKVYICETITHKGSSMLTASTSIIFYRLTRRLDLITRISQPK